MLPFNKAEYQKNYREKHKTEIKECIKNYREKHKNEINEYNKKYYKTNRKKIYEQLRKRYNENREKILEKAKQYHKNYYNQEGVKEKGNAKAKIYYSLNKENLKKRYKQRFLNRTEEQKQQENNRRKKYYAKNSKYIINQRKQKYYSDPCIHLAACMRSRVCYAIRKSKTTKSNKTTILLGCSIQDLKKHLEQKFKPGMSWENYGMGIDKWSVDHIKPCSSFNLVEKEEQIKCFHYTNLQPLWFSENSIKRNNIL